ncbi:hypothetical protein J4G37_26945, partial [Microvirga sp. 3-52]|nr:hypothetical protein [Microvirga sp. 3-52]
PEHAHADQRNRAGAWLASRAICLSTHSPPEWIQVQIKSALGDAPGLRDAESSMAAELMRQAGSRPTAILDEPIFLAWLGERRERQRRSGIPAAILSFNPDAADRLRHETAPCENDTAILLASDGFSALVDLYGAMDARAVMEAALISGLEPLVKLARKIETEQDPDGRLYPRFKASDDTTAILLRA